MPADYQQNRPGASTHSACFNIVVSYALQQKQNVYNIECLYKHTTGMVPKLIYLWVRILNSTPNFWQDKLMLVLG
jgi:hypothetical protein